MSDAAPPMISARFEGTLGGFRLEAAFEVPDGGIREVEDDAESAHRKRPPSAECDPV